MPKKYFPFVFLLVLFACKKVDIQFGDQFLDNGYTQVVKVDSFRVDVSTVYVDSFVTSGTGAALAGVFKDPVFGKITADSYFELAPPAYAQATDYIDSFRATTFDSIALIIRPGKSYLGDTTLPLHILVNRLSESIVPYDNSILKIYNTRSFPVFPTPIGDKNIYIRPNAGDSVIIRLDDNLGKDLLKKFQNPNDAEIRSNDAFLQYFKGIRLSSGGSENLIMGCNDSVTIRLYYKKPDLYLLNKTIDFTLINTTHQFNHITTDPAGTPLQDLPTKKIINSTQTANTAYMLYAAGAMVKLRFPTVRDILKLPDYTKILQASLLIRPVRGTYGSGYLPLPASVRLSATTQLNQIGDDLSSIDASGQQVIQTGNLSIDELYGENTVYTYDLTYYLRSLANDATINNNGLLFIPPSSSLQTEFGRVILGDRNNSAGKMELIIVYAAVQ